MRSSVIMCTFNGENYVIKQLESILNQTKRPNQIVISDDNSSDNTIRIIKNYVQNIKDVEIKIFRQKENLGYRKNFEYALSKQNGEVIFFADQDDIWVEDKIDTILNVFESNNNIDMVFSNAYILYNKGVSSTYLNQIVSLDEKDIKSINEGNPFKSILKTNVVTGATMAIRSSLKEKVMPFSNTMVHDYWVALIAAFTGRIHYIEKPLIFYRQHENNQIGVGKKSFKELNSKKTKDNRGQGLKELIELKNHLISNNYDSKYIFRLDNKIDHFQKRQQVARFTESYKLFIELFKGGYKDYSNGMKSFLKDLYHLMK